MFIGTIERHPLLFQTLPRPMKGDQQVAFQAGRLMGLRMEEPCLIMDGTRTPMTLDETWPLSFSILIPYPLLWVILRDASSIRLYASVETGTLVVDAASVVWVFTPGGGVRSYLEPRLSESQAAALKGTVIAHSGDCIEVVGQGIVFDACDRHADLDRGLPEWTREKSYD